MKIGLSLSLCVRDILDGAVNLDDVAVIITSTAVRKTLDWDWVINQYQQTYWLRHHPEKARELVCLLLERDKILQPRLTHNKRPLYTGTNWIDIPMVNDLGGIR